MPQVGTYGPFRPREQPLCPACHWYLSIRAEDGRWMARCRNGECPMNDKEAEPS